MAMRKGRALALADPARKQAVAAIQQYFDDNMDEPVGDLKAGLLLDFVLSELGPSIYNQAVADARAFFEERSQDLAAVCYYEEFPATTRRKS